MKSIMLRGRLGKGKLTLVDDEDYVLLFRRKWRISPDGYVVTTKNGGGAIKLHQLIVKANEDEEIDHIDRDKLNNQRNNLRSVPHSVNMCNAGPTVNGVRGVSWCSTKNRWRVKIKVMKRTKHLGYFRNFDEATKARLKAEVELFSQYKTYASS